MTVKIQLSERQAYNLALAIVRALKGEKVLIVHPNEEAAKKTMDRLKRLLEPLQVPPKQA